MTYDFGKLSHRFFDMIETLSAEEAHELLAQLFDQLWEEAQADIKGDVEVKEINDNVTYVNFDKDTLH